MENNAGRSIWSKLLCLDETSVVMNKKTLISHINSGWARSFVLRRVRATPADPRWGLNRWQRFLYALKILTGRETFEQRMARRYYD